MKRTSTLCIFLLLAATAYAQKPMPQSSNATQSAIAEAVRDYASQQSIPGVQWTVIVGGKAYSGATGLTDVENNVPASADSLFRIGSISKTLTATLAMRLDEQGTLSSADPVQKNCPVYPQKQWPVTLRQLLAHQGGVRNYRSSAEFFDTRHFASVTASVEIVAADALSFEPGTKYAYTSYGYNLVGCAIEGATKSPFFDVLKTQVLTPLSLLHVVVDETSAVIPHRARGYTLQKSGAVANAVFVDTSSKLPGGGLLATSADLAQFGHSLIAGKLLSTKERDLMWTEQTLSSGAATAYAIGWRVARTNGEREVYHGGESSGFSGMLYLLPDSDITVAVLANVDQIGDARLELVRKIAALVKQPR